MPKHERTAGQFDQREASRQSILDSIRMAGRIARIDVAHETGFSPSTVTSVTSEMLAAGLIEEITPDEKDANNKRGRPRVLLKIRGAAQRIAGIKVAQRSISVQLVDFEGTVILGHEMPLERYQMTKAELTKAIWNATKEACAIGGFSPKTLSALGIGLAGQVDASRNFVHWSSSLTSRNVNLGALLSDDFHCPVFIDNDANLVAKSEQLFGAGRSCRNFVALTIERGVGLGVVLDGVLHRGARGCGAEFGHTKVQYEGALCQCGQRGCLEAYIGEYAILRDCSVDPNSDGRRQLADVIEAARDGDHIAQSALDRAGRMFALGLANLINIFDPELIILSGAQTKFQHLYNDTVMDQVRCSVLQVDAPMPEIRVRKWGDMMWAKGAAAYAIEQSTVLEIRKLALNAA